MAAHIIAIIIIILNILFIIIIILIIFGELFWTVFSSSVEV